MGISKQIEEKLRTEYDKGSTLKEISSKYHITYQSIQSWISGTRPFSNMSLETVQKMFPKATINFTGDAPKIKDNNGSAVAVTGSNSTGNITQSFLKDSAKTSETEKKDIFQSKITELLDDDTFSSDEKIKVIKFLNK